MGWQDEQNLINLYIADISRKIMLITVNYLNTFYAHIS